MYKTTLDESQAQALCQKTACLLLEPEGGLCRWGVTEWPRDEVEVGSGSDFCKPGWKPSFYSAVDGVIAGSYTMMWQG